MPIEKELKGNEQIGNETSKVEQVLGSMPKDFNEFRFQVEQEKSPENFSSVYAEVAKNALMNWNGLSEEDAKNKIENSTYEELESQIGAESSMKAACRAMLGAENSNLFDNLYNGVLNDDKSIEAQRAFAVIAERASEYSDEENGAEKFTLDVLEEVHGQWMHDNVKKFFDPARKNKQYQFLDLNGIGFKEAKADLLFVEPILNRAGIEINQENLEDEYEENVDLAEDAGAYNSGEQHWTQLIADELYAEPLLRSRYMPNEVADAIRGNKELVEHIMETSPRRWGQEFEDYSSDGESDFDEEDEKYSSIVGFCDGELSSLKQAELAEIHSDRAEKGWD